MGRVGLVLVVMFAATMPLAGCRDALTDADFDQVRREQYLERFAYYSQINRYDLAEQTLQELSTVPGTEEEVAAGRAMLDFVDALNSLSGLYAIADVLGSENNSPEFLALANEGGGAFTKIVHKPLRDIYDAMGNWRTKALAFAEKYPNASIKSNNFVFFLSSVPIVTIRGELDVSDVYLLLAITQLARSIAGMVLAHDLGVTVPGALELVQWLQSRTQCQPYPWSQKACLFKFIAYVLNRFPTFLTHVEPDGKAIQKLIAPDLADSFGYLLKFFEVSTAEVDDQSDDIFAVIPPGMPKTSGTPLDKYELVAQNFLVPSSGFYFEEAIFEQRTIISTDSAVFQTGTSIRQQSLDGMARIQLHLLNDPSMQSLDLQDLMTPMLELFLPSLYNAAVVRDALKGAIDFDTVQDTLNGLGLSIQDAAVALLEEFFPRGMVALNMYGPIVGGVSLRDMAPYSDFHAPFKYGEGTEIEATLAIDYECEYYATSTLICRTGATRPVDRVMFPGYPYELDSDGIAEVSAYLAVREDVYKNILSLDVFEVPVTSVTYSLPGATPGLQPATNRTINFVMHRVVDYFTDILSNANLLAPLQPVGADATGGQ